MQYGASTCSFQSSVVVLLIISYTVYSSLLRNLRDGSMQRHFRLNTFFIFGYSSPFSFFQSFWRGGAGEYLFSKRCFSAKSKTKPNPTPSYIKVFGRGPGNPFLPKKGSPQEIKIIIQQRRYKNWKNRFSLIRRWWTGRLTGYTRRRT